jgi:hypothetical protein
VKVILAVTWIAFCPKIDALEVLSQAGSIPADYSAALPASGPVDWPAFAQRVLKFAGERSQLVAISLVRYARSSWRRVKEKAEP